MGEFPSRHAFRILNALHRIQARMLGKTVKMEEDDLEFLRELAADARKKLQAGLFNAD